MKITITGRVIAVDHARQGFTIKPDNAQAFRVYAAEKVFAKLAGRIEGDRIAGRNETRGCFTLSGKVLVGFTIIKVRTANDHFKAVKAWVERGFPK